MPNLNKKQKIILISLSIIFTFIFCESFLYVSGLVTKFFFLPHYKFSKTYKESFVIFCFGDSFTYGLGTDFAHSYPAQLEKILSDYDKETDIKVFNFGVPGYNSAQTLKEIQNAINNIMKPDIVIVICGANDHWNFEQVRLTWDTHMMNSFFSRFKTYKMLAVFFENIRYKIEKSDSNKKSSYAKKILSKENKVYMLIAYGNTYRKFDQYKQALDFYEKAINIAPDNSIANLELLRCYKLNHEYTKALNVLRYAIEKQPEDKLLYAELNDIFIKINKIETMIMFYEEFLKKFPQNVFARKNLAKAYVKIAEKSFLNKQMKKAKDYYQKALNLMPGQNKQIDVSINKIEDMLAKRKEHSKLNFKASAGNYLRALRDFYLVNTFVGEEISEHITYKNLISISKICKKNKIQLIFSGYPDRVPEPMEKVALFYDIPLINQKDSFFKLLKNKPFEYYFLSRDDPHCTKEGYRVMAENIAKTLVEFLN